MRKRTLARCVPTQIGKSKYQLRSKFADGHMIVCRIRQFGASHFADEELDHVTSVMLHKMPQADRASWLKVYLTLKGDGE